MYWNDIFNSFNDFNKMTNKEQDLFKSKITTYYPNYTQVHNLGDDNIYLELKDNKYELSVLVPGFSKEDLVIIRDIEENSIHIKSEVDKENPLIKGIDTKVKLKREVIEESFSAKVENGILTITAEFISKESDNKNNFYNL